MSTVEPTDFVVAGDIGPSPCAFCGSREHIETHHDAGLGSITRAWVPVGSFGVILTVGTVAGRLADGVLSVLLPVSVTVVGVLVLVTVRYSPGGGAR